MIAKMIHASRIPQTGTHGGTEMKPRIKVASRGQITPRSSSGHAAAEATSAESQIFSLGSACPKSAVTAQPKRAERMSPSERVTNARMLWMMAMGRQPALLTNRGAIAMPRRTSSVQSLPRRGSANK